MKSEKLLDLIGRIDDEFVQNAAELTPKAKLLVFLNKPLVRVVAAVLCLSILAGGFALVVFDRNRKLVPIYDGAYLTAGEAKELFGASRAEGVATTSYTKRYYSEDQPPELEPLPDDEYLTVYNFNPLTKALSKKEHNKFVENRAENLVRAFGYAINRLNKEEYSGDEYLQTHYQTEGNGIGFFFNHTTGYREKHVDYSVNRIAVFVKEGQPCLNGGAWKVDLTQSEGEISKSFEWIKDELCDILGCSFDSETVYKTDNTVSVLYYNRDEVPFSGDNVNYIGDNMYISIDPEGTVYKYAVWYTQYRIPADKYITADVRCKKIPLEKAEEYLRNGYVFGGHSCPLCMAAQDPVDFENYDYVGLEYVLGGKKDANGVAKAVPFYAFYKKIGKAENGKIIYAKTYVCAIEVSGLKEYYEAQANSHPKTE